jgi:DNA replication and repair protein RecF
VEDAYAARLKSARGRDAAAGRALEGPHRADLLVRHAPKNMDAQACSTGEQKALLIGLVLANARLHCASFGAPPLLLLDEVAAHLDARRRTALFDELERLGAQAWMTGTDASLFENLGDRAQLFNVAHGEITPQA